MQNLKATVLYFISFGQEDGRQTIAFCLRRDVSDAPPLQLYWYTQGLCLTNAKISEHTQLYGWCCIGKSPDIETLLSAIQHGTIINNSNGAPIQICFPNPGKLKELPDPDSSANKIPDIPPASDAYRKTEFTIDDWASHVGKNIDFLGEELADAITGYRTKITPAPKAIEPRGLLAKGSLSKKISRYVVFTDEPSGIDIDFRGTGNHGLKELQGYKGLIRGVPKDIGSIKIQFLTTDGTLIGETQVTPINGWANWEVNLKTAVPSGILRLVDNNDKVIAGEKFHLLMNIDLNVYPVEAQAKDLYGRTLHIGDRSIPILPVELVLWQPTYRERPEVLSDRIGALLAALGPEILIHDPYGLGTLEKTESGLFKLNESSKCFLNSIIVALTQTRIQVLSILIDPQRLGLSSQKDALVERYRGLLSSLKPLGLKKAYIGMATTRFHDRYLVGLSPEKRLYRSSKSITGLLETDELELNLDTGDKKLLKIAQILARWDKADKRQILG